MAQTSFLGQKKPATSAGFFLCAPDGQNFEPDTRFFS